MSDPIHRPKLVLLTGQYPFGKGEEFLETELPYLAQCYDIDIIPTSFRFDVNRKRSVPNNVSICQDVPLEFTLSHWKRIIWLLQHPKKIVALLTLFWHELPYLFPYINRSIKFFSFSLRALIVYRTLEKLYAGEQVDVFYSYWLNYGAFALTLRKKSEIETLAVSRVHGGDLYLERSASKYLPGQKQTIQGLDRVVCISEHGRDYLERHYPELAHKFVLKRLGVRQPPARNQFSAGAALNIVTCSYLVPVKRITLLIRSLACCSIPINWTHLGGGDLESALRIEASQLPQNIRWRITGMLPNKDILLFYAENPVDLFVSVSRSEGLPVSIMEAMSYGIPVAATDVGGIGELVTDNKNGFLWSGDILPEDINSTFEKFFAMPVDRKLAMRESAWQTWNDKVNADKQYPEFVRWLTELG